MHLIQTLEAQPYLAICFLLREINHYVRFGGSSGLDLFQIEVEDNGVGFPDPALACLDAVELQTDSGFGLLGIRRLVRARGGGITAEKRNSGQGGACIQLTL